MLAVAALAGCAQWDAGSVGQTEDISTASVDPVKQCTYSHYTNFTEAKSHMAVSCLTTRQIYTTCDIWVWPVVGSPKRVRTHGSQRCSATTSFNEYSLGAMGSIGTVWMRLDNTSRRWKWGDWGKLDCSVYRNSNNQSILECDHLQGRTGDPCPCRAARAGSATPDTMPNLASKLAPATRARVTRACGELSSNALRSLNPNGHCARAGRQALSELPAAQRRKALGQLKNSGISLRDQSGRDGSAE